MKVHLVISILAAALIVSVSGAAHADTPTPTPIPVSCNANARTISAYKAGLKSGEAIVNSAWARVNDCNRVDYFLGVVYDNISRLTPTSANPLILCRYTGTADGVYNALDTLYGTCSDQCFLDGTFAGELSGEIYCELSILLHGLSEASDFLRGPVEVCGFNFETGCDSAFISTTTSYVSTDTPPQRCDQYTLGQFEAVWDQARNNQCAFDPQPPPSHANADENSSPGVSR